MNYWKEVILYLKAQYPISSFKELTVDTREVSIRIKDTFNIEVYNEDITGTLKDAKSLTRHEVFKKINFKKNYLVLLLSKTSTNSLLFDCRGSLIDEFEGLFDDNYCIINKKYDWLIFCDRLTKCYYQKNSY